MHHDDSTLEAGHQSGAPSLATQAPPTDALAMLRAYGDVVNLLSAAPSVAVLCRRAVELGRERLGFERLGLMFVGEEPMTLVSAVGVDEIGRIHEDLHGVFTVSPVNTVWHLLTGATRCTYFEHVPLCNWRGEIVGTGTHISAPMTSGSTIIGCIVADNLLTGTPISPLQCELLTCYAATVGHLYMLKHAEAAQREAHHFLQQLLDAIPTPIFYKDKDGIYLGCNTAFAHCFGITPDALVGQTLGMLAPADLAAMYQERDRQLYEQGGVQIYEGEAQYADGTRHPVVYSKALFTHADGAVGGIVGVMMDITDRKAAEERERALTHLRQVEQMRAHFLSIVSHELKTPLTPILGALEMLASGTLGPLTDGQEQALALAHRQSRRMHRLVNDLLDIFQAERGLLSLHCEPVDLAEAIAYSTATYAARYAERNLALETCCAEGLPPVCADAQRLGQVLDNLLENALKYTQEGGVRVCLTREGNQLCLEVRDTGIGLDADSLTHVFEPFYQAGTPHRKGLGLGLSIVKHLVEAHGGTIQVASAGPRQGTTFLIRLPAMEG
jgi:PAS domain S-box-containing protein